ncbi:zinc finger and BTB domain-containing protein 7C isoform X2 [Rhincodon typus]|nr:zinc finger and BTB domain-containing protein 7C isoform X2 [Rhincodon typus]XP_048460203.1 zinc finger and BTB domain-containing protein 7C isoform X2 [Rhincodon typus]XP_048460208.1 zinc finger and BTB domain-containing protein 7C isoform X2 [Rhincodon typus]
MASTTDGLIGIPFPDHSNELLCSLNEQRRDGLLCDLILVVKDQEYKTHRSILAAFSKYFKNLFTTDILEEQHNVYQIDFVTPEALSAILEFAYTSTLTISSSNVKDVLSAAQLLEIQCLIQVCGDIMESSGRVSVDRRGPEKQCIQNPQEDLLVENFRESPQQGPDEFPEHGLKESHEKDCNGFPEQGHKENPQQDLKEPPQQDLEETLQDRINESEENFQERHRWNKEYNFQNTLTNKLIEKQCRELPCEFLSQFTVNDPGGCLRPVRDFSLESLLKEGLCPRGDLLNGRTCVSPLRPGFFPPHWNGGYNRFPQLVQHQDVDQLPLNLVVKKEKIKEEAKEDLPSTTSLCDFFKGIMLENGHNNLGTLKDFNSYLNILGPSYLAAVYPTWPLEYEKKMRPKASQQCPICNKVIQGAGKLPRHMRTHTGEKPYMCSICEVRFTRQDKLKIHMRKHTGERPYTCIHCNARFVHNYDLKNHLRIHTGIRPYQCVHCYKSFTRSDHLHRHIKRQSCRLPRPRRGRRPAAWHSASLLYAQGGPSQSTHSNENSTNIPPRPEDRLLNASKFDPGNTEKNFHGNVQNSKILLNESAVKERENPMPNMLNGNHIVDERDRGIFAFTLSHNNTFSHLPQQYYSTSDPWSMQFNPMPSIQEASK